MKISLSLALLAFVSTAHAHAILIDSSPAPQAHVAPGHLLARLRFNSRIDAGRSKLTLVQPGGDRVVLAAAGADTPDVLTTAADLVPGHYELRWQVLAIDGHITRGIVPFEVDAAPGARGAP